MRLQGTGVLALGREMQGPAQAKHHIKRVDRFLGNAQVEIDAVSEALFHELRPAQGPVMVLADWTDRHNFQQLVLAFPRNGRAPPYVQRLDCNHSVNVEEYFGPLSELGIRRGWRSRDWGWGTMNEIAWGPVRLVTVYDRDAKEPCYLVTNLSEPGPAEIVRFYKRRRWIEAAFRDLKNRNWGMGMDQVRLTQAARLDRHFIILAVAESIG